ncbi:MAG: ATP-binding protein [Cyanobacteria bacterium P01_F01_bin.33]
MTISCQNRLRVNSEPNSLTKVRAWYDNWCLAQRQRWPWIDEHTDAIGLMLSEGLTNAVRHAHAHLDRTTPVDIEIEVSADRLELVIWDRGAGFEPDTLAPYEPEQIDLRNPATGGYGWFLMRKLSDVVTYRRYDNPVAKEETRNCLRIIKYAGSPRAEIPPRATDPLK